MLGVTKYDSEPYQRNSVGFAVIDILNGNCVDVMKKLPEKYFNTVVTSPPYWGLRDYGTDKQLGLENTPEEFVKNLLKVFKEVKRVLKDDGTLWLNLGDSYSGHCSRASNNGRAGFGNKREGVFLKTGKGLKAKDLVGMPWRVAFALQEDGWYLRQDIIWHKPNPMPESVKDRCTKAHEYIFLLSKNSHYYFDHEAIQEEANQDLETKNKRSVWTVNTKPFKEAHFAVFPTDLIEPCIKAGSPEDGNVLDPFGGSGTTGLVADRLNRNATIIELNKDYVQIAEKRIYGDAPLFTEVNLK
mgnify:CR=1 FL=1